MSNQTIGYAFLSSIQKGVKALAAILLFGCLFSGSLGVSWSDASLSLQMNSLQPLTDIAIIENVAYFSANDGIYFVKLPGL